MSKSWQVSCEGCSQQKQKGKKNSASYVIVCSRGHLQRFCQRCWKLPSGKKGENKSRAERLVQNGACPKDGCDGYYIEAKSQLNGRVSSLWNLDDRPELRPEYLLFVEKAEELFSESKLAEVIKVIYREKGNAKSNSMKIVTKMKDLKRLGALQAQCQVKLRERWEQLNYNHKLGWIEMAKSEKDRDNSESAISEPRLRLTHKKSNSSIYAKSKAGVQKIKTMYDDEADQNEVDDLTMIKFSRSSANSSPSINVSSPKPQLKPELRSPKQFPVLKLKPRPVEEKIENPEYEKWLSARCPDSGDIYWYHKDTEEVSWNSPDKWIFRKIKNADPPDPPGELRRSRAPLLIVQDIERKAPYLMKSTTLLPEMQRAIIDLEQEKAELERLGRRRDESIQELTEKLQEIERVKEELMDSNYNLELQITDNRQELSRTEDRVLEMEKQRDMNKKVADRRLQEIRYLQGKLESLNNGKQGQERNNYDRRGISGPLMHQTEAANHVPRTNMNERAQPGYYKRRPVFKHPPIRHSMPDDRNNHQQLNGTGFSVNRLVRESDPVSKRMDNNNFRQGERHIMGPGPRNECLQGSMNGHMRGNQQIDHDPNRLRPSRGGNPQRKGYPQDGFCELPYSNPHYRQSFNENPNHLSQSVKQQHTQFEEGDTPLPDNDPSMKKQQWEFQNPKKQEGREGMLPHYTSLPAGERQQQDFNNSFPQQGERESKINNNFEHQSPNFFPQDSYNKMQNPIERSNLPSSHRGLAAQHQGANVTINTCDDRGQYHHVRNGQQHVQMHPVEGKPPSDPNSYHQYDHNYPTYPQENFFQNRYGQDGPQQNNHVNVEPSGQIPIV